MVNFGEFQPFEGAEMIRPTIAVLTKQPPGGTMRLFKWLVAGHPPENLSDVIAAAPRMHTDRLGADAWELEADEVVALRQKLSRGGKRLAEYAGRKLLYGVKTGLNEVYLVDTGKRDALVADDPGLLVSDQTIPAGARHPRMALCLVRCLADMPEVKR